MPQAQLGVPPQGRQESAHRCAHGAAATLGNQQRRLRAWQWRVAAGAAGGVSSRGAAAWGRRQQQRAASAAGGSGRGQRQQVERLTSSLVMLYMSHRLVNTSVVLCDAASSACRALSCMAHRRWAQRAACLSLWSCMKRSITPRNLRWVMYCAKDTQRCEQPCSGAHCTWVGAGCAPGQGRLAP